LRFLITGLPRSRTAWLALLTTGRHSYCHHEPLKHTQSFEEYAAFWNAPDLPYIGISDSGIVPQLGRVLDEVKPRTLIVQRNPGAVCRSLEAILGPAVDPSPYVMASAKQLEAHLSHPLVKTIRIEALDDVAEVRKAVAWLMPGNEAPINEALFHMNVQVTRQSILDGLAVGHNHWYRH